jgi:protein-S-isoprenylcysteine O-methyltransferase Ste14
MTPTLAFAVIWVAWIVSWTGAAVWSAPVVQRPARGQERWYQMLTLAGCLLLFLGVRAHRVDPRQLWDFGPGMQWSLVGVAVLGFLFTWWARVFLGPLWSRSVTTKAAHRVVDSGPYAIVRHPIYTGILAATWATALAESAPAAIAGALLLTLAFWLKARLEEQFLREQLGPEDYDSYRRRTPMLIPFGARSR